MLRPGRSRRSRRTCRRARSPSGTCSRCRRRCAPPRSRIRPCGGWSPPPRGARCAPRTRGPGSAGPYAVLGPRVPIVDVDVRAADRRDRDADEDLIGPEVRDRDGFDFRILRRPFELHRGLHHRRHLEIPPSGLAHGPRLFQLSIPLRGAVAHPWIGWSFEVRYPTTTKRYSRRTNSWSSSGSPVSTRRTGVAANFPGVATTITFLAPIRLRTAGLTWRLPRPKMNPCAPIGLTTSVAFGC